MPLPKSESELLEAGYKYESTGRCRSVRCNQKIAWFRTPKGRLIPLNQGTLEPHWATCIDREQFGQMKN